MKLIIHILATLTLIGVISGALLSNISDWADPLIAFHKEEATKQAIFVVQKEANYFEKLEKETLSYFKVYNDSTKSQFLGYALPYQGNGFQGAISLMVGVKPDMKEITGMLVLDQVETPGLGTKIVDDPSVKEDSKWFPNQFIGVICNTEIGIIKNQKPSKNTEIQAITGATITSKAVANIIAAGLQDLRKSEGGE